MSSLITIPTIAKLHQLLGLPSPSHPLISVFNFDDIQIEPDSTLNAMVTDFYIIALKKDCAGGILTNLSVSEIAYQLGFEHAQSFHRLFRKQNDISPLEFRNSFN